ncbi:MAG: transglutaminase-like domain-containing protein [Planctomycetota bacterium]|jgi:hypothetical protein
MTCAPALLLALLALGPPSGPPAVGPLERYEPRVYDFTFDVTVATAWQFDARSRRSYRLVDAPIVMPVIFQGAYSAVAADSLRPGLWLEGRPDAAVAQRTRLDDGFPYQTKLAVLTIDEFQGMFLRWQLGYRVQVWSSRLRDEAAAAAVPWPRQWPAEVEDGLKPQTFIESDDPFFRQAVEHASGGKLRLTSPYLAAKDLVRYCVNRIRVSGDGVRRGEFGVLRGLEIAGARETAAAGLGGPHDLVCICVATLRAAGIPARPVIGVEEVPGRVPRTGGPRPEFVSWAEFYLPRVGWVPFDPLEMRGRVRTLDVRRPWPEFGTMKDLNRRIPLAYHFIPPAAVQTPQHPAVWGWDPRPGGDPSSEQQIRIQMISRGRGTEQRQQGEERLETHRRGAEDAEKKKIIKHGGPRRGHGEDTEEEENLPRRRGEKTEFIQVRD